LCATALAGAAAPRTRKTEYGNTMPFQAAYSGEPAERTRERIREYIVAEVIAAAVVVAATTEPAAAVVPTSAAVLSTAPVGAGIAAAAGRAGDAAA
jgi:hypothetical protein